MATRGPVSRTVHPSHGAQSGRLGRRRAQRGAALQGRGQRDPPQSPGPTSRSPGTPSSAFTGPSACSPAPHLPTGPGRPRPQPAAPAGRPPPAATGNSRRPPPARWPPPPSPPTPAAPPFPPAAAAAPAARGSHRPIRRGSAPGPPGPPVPRLCRSKGPPAPGSARGNRGACVSLSLLGVPLPVWPPHHAPKPAPPPGGLLQGSTGPGTA